MILHSLAAVALAAKPLKALLLLAPGEVAPQAVLAAPPAPDNARTRTEIAELHRIADTVTPARMAQARFDEAHEDASLFAPTLGAGWDMAKLPATAALLTLVQEDASVLASASKKAFLAPASLGTGPTLKTCDPDDKPLTFYPSGNATLGYGWPRPWRAPCPRAPPCCSPARTTTPTAARGVRRTTDRHCGQPRSGLNHGRRPDEQARVPGQARRGPDRTGGRLPALDAFRPGLRRCKITERHHLEDAIRL